MNDPTHEVTLTLSGAEYDLLRSLEQTEGVSAGTIVGRALRHYDAMNFRRGLGPPGDLEPLDEYITLERASELSGVSRATLRSKATRGKLWLRTERQGNVLVTTRRWLNDYLLSRDGRRQSITPLPEGYFAQERWGDKRVRPLTAKARQIILALCEDAEKVGLRRNATPTDEEWNTWESTADPILDAAAAGDEQSLRDIVRWRHWSEDKAGFLRRLQEIVSGALTENPE